MKLGSNNISAVRIGSTIVNKIYLGANQIWSAVSYLLDTYSGAAAAYSLRQLKSGVTNAIEVRRSADDTTQDIGFVDGELDTASLEEFVNCDDVAPADHGSGAAAAYSLRYVSASYTGDVIQVRRSSDDATQDFNPTEITDGTLATFCGAGDGFVTTWYDQSGNGNDATQTTASEQPQIVSSGSVILENGKPTIQWDASNNNFIEAADSSSLDLTTAFSLFITYNLTSYDPSSTFPAVVSKGQSTGTNGAYGFRRRDKSSESYAFFGFDSSANRLDYRTGSVTPPTGQILNTLTSTLPTVSLYEDGSQINWSSSVSITSFRNTSDTLQLGNGNSERAFNGNIQEVILYPSDQSSNRPKIEANINNYYSIYTNTNNGYVTTWYDQSGNGYNATQTTAASQPQIVSSGSVIEENGKPAAQFDGSDDYMSLSSISLTDRFSEYIVNTHTSVSNNHSIGISRWVSGTNNRQFTWRIQSDTAYDFFISQNGSNTYSLADYSSATINTQYLYAGELNLSESQEFEHYRNNVLISSSFSSGFSNLFNSTLDMELGSFNGGGSNFQGYMQEVVFYNSDQSSNRTGIETNINDFYSIY